MKLKRIFALLGAVLLSGLFILAIVLAAMGAGLLALRRRALGKEAAHA